MRRQDHPLVTQYTIVLLAAVACSLATQASGAVEPTGRPNIVFFLVDDMGWIDCGAYGSKYYETPHIDRLASRGVLFTDAYSANPLCTPTRASILTGQYPARLGITAAVGAQPPQPPDAPRYPESASRNRRTLSPESLRFLSPDAHTLAEAFRDAGYRTGHFGKWHLGVTEPHWPEQQGYQVAWHGTPDPGPPGPNGYFSPYSFKAGTITPGAPGEYIVDRLTDEVIAFIDANRDRPFLASVWQFGVHGPWGHREEYTRQFLSKQDPRGQQRNPVMASMLKSIDESLGRIVARLDELKLTEKTIIVFTSDNGGNVHSNTAEDRDPESDKAPRSRIMESYHRYAGYQPPTNNHPLRAGKGTLYEGGIRVPLIVSWPGVVPEGKKSGQIVCSIDHYPTLLELAGIQRPHGVLFDGVSLASVLRAPESKLERTAVFNFFPHGNPSKPPGVTVRKGDWKLIRWYEPTPDKNELLVLYNLKDDLSESRNVAADHPALVEELNREIDGFLEHTKALVPKPNPRYQDRTERSS